MKKILIYTALFLTGMLVIANAQPNTEDWKIQDVNEYSKWSFEHKRVVFEHLPIPMQNLTLLSLGLQDPDNEVRSLAAASAVYSFGTMQELKRAGLKCPYQISPKDFHSIQESLIKNLDDSDASIRFISVEALVLSDARSEKVEGLLLRELSTNISVDSKRELVDWMLKYGYHSPELEKIMLTLEKNGLNTNQPAYPTQSLVTPN